MSTAAERAEARATSVRVTDSELIVELEDGRTISTPLTWYPRLVYGTPRERRDFELVGGGIGIHWPLLDEDVSVESMLAGRRSGEDPASLKRWKEKLGERRKQADPGPWVKERSLPDWWNEDE